MPTDEKQEHLSINQFLEAQLQVFSGHFQITQDSNDQEAIHKMRLALKRIRTIHKLKKYIHLKTFLTDEVFIELKSVFAASGKLRDIQVQQDLLTAYSSDMNCPFFALSDFFIEKEKCAVEFFNKTIGDINFDADITLQTENDEKGSQSDNTDVVTEILDYIKYKIRVIQKLLFGTDDEEKVHEIRKHVKQLFYVLQFLKDYFPGSLLDDYDLEGIVAIGDHLGSWHDRQVLKDQVVEFLNENGDDFIAGNIEYQILLFVLEDEKLKILKGLDVKLFLEIINLRVLLGESITVGRNAGKLLLTG